ncbi:MAG: hypothetical protein GF387_01535 [Candidatus Portnoybacteria bacterium]|nr:hypothetical protein [Candidatus Portnoybacteria bacterium]
MKKNYLKISFHKDLENKKDRFIFRFLEIFPGVTSWVTLILVIFLSWKRPVWVAFFIIAFDIYWLLKTLFFSFHQKAAFKKLDKNLSTDWLVQLNKVDISKSVIPVKQWEDIIHLIIFPMYKEGLEVVRPAFESVVNSKYPSDRMIVVLAVEERAGDNAMEVAEKIKQEFGDKFYKFLITVHPKDIVGELAGKGSNETWAARRAKEKIIDPLGIPYENIVVSSFDIDTQVYPQYFSCLTYNYLTCKKPLRSSFQPIPIYNNNIWDAPAISRVVAMGATFWYSIQQERSERLATFSSHSMSFKALVEMDFWPVKNVSEDSRIFWKAYLFYDGDYESIPLFYPVSMDANLANKFSKTLINVFKQQTRWSWGIENVPFFIFGSIKNKKMPLRKRLFHSFNLWEGFWSWATNSILIFLLGWLPLILGGEEFNRTILSYNLPRMTRLLMTLAMFGLVASAFYALKLLPPRPAKYSSKKYIWMILQWLLIPLTMIVFGAIPALISQTRLMFKKYMGFWVTEKSRK